MKEKKPLHLFIDTNTLLGFYRYSQDDLKKLGELEDLIVKTKDIILYVNRQQVDEFYRNREKVITTAVKEITAKISLPVLFSGHKEYKQIISKARVINEDVERLKKETLVDAKKGTLKADQVINRLFNNYSEFSQKVLAKAEKRMAVGNPPGKQGSLGDAIHWEYLLENVPESEDIHLVTADGDFGSALDSSKVNNMLEREWGRLKGANVYLYENLNGFFAKHFEHIQLKGMSEYVKEDLVNQLSRSGSFDTSRGIIEKMTKMGTFTEEQVDRIVKISLNNEQVFNAHKYSPDLVGAKLWQIISPYWDGWDIVDQQIWQEHFPDYDFEDEGQ